MKNVTFVLAAALALTAGAAWAEGSTDSKATTTGATGAMAGVNKDGVATDPGGVAEQSKGKGVTKASPGTVGAAPGADVPSSNPKH